MTESILEKEVVLALKPDHIAPMVAALSSEAAPKSSSGGVYETGSGWLGKTRWERESVESALSQGQLDFELIARGLKNLSQKREYPASIEDHWKCFLGGAKVSPQPLPSSAMLTLSRPIFRILC
jgi:multifunctional beta-oxidation protein